MTASPEAFNKFGEQSEYAFEMYISPSRKIIFLHSRKVAGSSITLSLASHMADDDIMIGCWHEAARMGIPYNPPALKTAKSQSGYYLAASAKQFLLGRGWHPGPGDMNRLIKRYYWRNHDFQAGAQSGAGTVRKMMGPDWDQYFKFAFVRNPWDHAVSDYYWRGGDKKDVAFKDFLRLLQNCDAPDPKNLRPTIISNWSVYTINDQISVDFIGRFENLETDLAEVSQQIGIDVGAGMPRAKSSHRDRSQTLKALYDEESIEIVRQVYRNEIDAFDYAPPF